MTHLEENYPDLHNDLGTFMSTKSLTAPLQTNTDVIPLLINRLDSPEYRDAFSEFIDVKNEDKNFEFLWSYMQMIDVLLAHTRADRTDDWELHVNSFTRMLKTFMR